MTELAIMLERLIGRSRSEGDQVGEVTPDLRLYVKVFKDGVVNVSARTGHALWGADVEDLRAAMAEAGYREVESWVASQGVSWLSGGLSAGVSFRTVKM